MKKSPFRFKMSRRLIIAMAVLFFLLLLAVLFSMIGINELVDIWWFDMLGYQFYYWQRLLSRYLVFGSVSLLFFLLFFANFWVASRYLRKLPQADNAFSKEHRSKIIKAFQSGSIFFYAPLSLALAIPLAMPLCQHWEKFLFFVFGERTGVLDPFYNQDISFYLFSFPIYSLLQQRLLIATAILLVGLVLLYVIKNRLLTQKLFQFSGFAKWHLSFVVLGALGIEVWDMMLQRYAMVYDTSHQPLFSGPGYIQMNIIVPLIWITMVLLVATGVMMVFCLQFRKGYKVLAITAVALALAFGARHSDFLPKAVQTYSVKPNEIEKERKFIEKSVKATLNAYDLNRVEVRNFEHNRFPDSYDEAKVQNVLRNIPVWDAKTLKGAFQQLQELRSYYTFPLVSVDRYPVAGNRQQVFLSPRELEYENLPGDADNWINNHLVYTHGYGVVMTPASQVGGRPLTWFINNIPTQSNYGFEIGQPRIYYGMGDYPYAFAPNSVGEMDYPKGNNNVTSQYDGRGGVTISSLFRKYVFAQYFGDFKDILFSTKITKESKALLRRQILERINYLAPYLMLDQMPYLVVKPRGIFWIVDAYTSSNWYPGAASYEGAGGSINYLRNSVKIVVDAYNGDVTFYAYDDNDPIIKAYRRIYPGFFKDKDAFPEDLKEHIRYPKDLFDIQMQIYAKYHQTDPQVFYQQEDLWTYAQDLNEDTTVPRKPYYVTSDMIQSGQLEFMLLLPMFPKGRDNLRVMAVAGCDPQNYGKIHVYDFPKGELVYGPAQIDALINQDPAIAQQFTLWDQAGSSVVRGKMIILPVENSVLFIQPVYLKSTSRVKIPELQRVIMSEGRVVVMAKSLEEAYAELRYRVKEEMESMDQRFPTVTREKPESSHTQQAPEQGQEKDSAVEQAPSPGNETAPEAIPDKETPPEPGGIQINT